MVNFCNKNGPFLFCKTLPMFKKKNINTLQSSPDSSMTAISGVVEYMSINNICFLQTIFSNWDKVP